MGFASAAEKRAFTRDMFARLAPRYELVNVVMSLGQVRAWRRATAAAACVADGGWVLDVAAGHGGLSRALARHWPAARVLALDFVPQMVQLGRMNDRLVRWVEGDALQLPFPDGWFGAVTSGFMLRNVVDVQAALAEQVRVVQPGGRVVCLEMTWPRHPLFRPLFRLYFGGLVPFLGWLLTGQADAYRYLPRSVAEFMSPPELVAAMERAGLSQVHYRTMMLGTVTLHVGIREG